MKKLTEKEKAESIVKKTVQFREIRFYFPSLALVQFSTLKLRQFDLAALFKVAKTSVNMSERFFFYWERNSFYCFLVTIILFS